MKVILFLLGFFVAAQAQYQIPFEEQLNTQVTELGFKLLYLEYNAKQIADQEKVLYKSQISNTRLKAIEILTDDESLAKLTIGLNNAVEKGEKVQECLNIYKKAMADLSLKFEKTLIEDFEFGGKVLDLAKEAVLLESQSVSALFNENLEGAKNQCRMYPLKCKIIGEYTEHISQLQQVIMGMKGMAIKEINEVYDTLKLKASDEIFENIILPVKKCVNKVPA